MAKNHQMKKTLALVLATSLLSAVGCKKKDPPIIVDPPPPPSSYFKFKFDGTANYFNVDFPQYMPFYADEVGGYQVANTSLAPSVGLRLSWPADDTVSEADLMALKGKTLYFSDTMVHPRLSYTQELASQEWTSIDTNNTSYNVKITNITFYKKDTSAGIPLKTYVIHGTCNALLSRSGEVKLFSDGEFNFVVSRQDH